MISYFRKPNFVFFGTPEFAAVVLEKLVAGGFPPSLVACNPDKPTGRKKIITPPPTKSLILKHGTWNIKVLQPEKLDASFKFQASSFKPKFAVVAAYAKIIPQEIISLFPLGVIGVHPSLLPKYRGSSPIQSAILNGEEETGVTLYLLDEKVDHGPVIENRKWKIENRITYPELQKQLSELGGNLLAETLPEFFTGEIRPQAQNEAEATYTKKFTSADGFVAAADLASALAGNCEKSSAIERKIRALNPEPGVWTYANGVNEHAHANNDVGATKKLLKLLEAELADGRLRLKKIQLEGEKPKAV